MQDGDTLPRKHPRRNLAATEQNDQSSASQDVSSSTLPMESQSTIIPSDGAPPSINGKRAIDVRNRHHKDIWVAMKRRDSLSFERQCKLLRTSGVELDGVSYTLMINGTLIFSKKNDIQQPLLMIEEMKEAGIHPSLIRFLARLIVMYFEMWSLNSRPIISNWLAITRSSWLSAVFVTRRTNKCDENALVKSDEW
ncbi:conserved hypothetical protein [Theileria equi strain WA]|uniref:Uncharacterized protein n=1 Tax=Theileria equi strain WA TaxID=1537102 RepID=L1L9B6_THEEQ|nr:conserved hypothetical protein [Theileria equi strain WA]EKX72091.1 conserved hypothetical protein [Theileria equi strain WA]|eukprot:XP_004831543.1 conserved hypothetical protein [Theileria equi strain WA]